MSRFSIVLLLLAVAYVAADSNSKKCPENETWNICGELCGPTCDVPRPNPRFCPTIECTPNFTGGCRCNKGYVRNTKKGSCVKEQQCNKS
nr:chymotrypsin inhibitor-like [Nomia melanderi]